jgi:hypothetical protein
LKKSLICYEIYLRGIERTLQRIEAEVDDEIIQKLNSEIKILKTKIRDCKNDANRLGRVQASLNMENVTIKTFLRSISLIKFPTSLKINIRIFLFETKSRVESRELGCNLEKKKMDKKKYDDDNTRTFLFFTPSPYFSFANLKESFIFCRKFQDFFYFL